MKNSIRLFFLLALICASTVISCHQTTSVVAQEKKPFQLKVKVKGFENGYLKLIAIYCEQNYGLDSFYVDANGNSTLKMDTALSGGLYLVVFPDNTIVQALVDEDQQFSMEFDKDDIINTMKVSNSIDNELLYINLKFETAINKRMDSLQQLMNKADKGSAGYDAIEAQMQKLKNERKAHIKWFADNKPNTFFTKFKLAGQNPELRKIIKPDGTPDEDAQVYYYRNDYWNNYDFSDVRMLHTPVYFNKLKKYMLDITPQVPDSVIKYADIVSMKSKADRQVFKFTVNWIAVHYKDAKMMGRESVHVFMVEKFWTPDQAWWEKDYEIQKLQMQAREMKVSLLGKIGQDIKGINEYGKPVSLYDIKADFTVIFIFSYDCGNCKKETPKLMKVYNEWKNKGMDIFSICIDGDKDKWKAYLKEHNMTFHNMFDPDNASNFRAHYYFEATPGLFVLDKNHKIIASGLGSEFMPTLFERELKK